MKRQLYKEIAHFNNILKYVSKKTLLILDIDNVLVHPRTYFCSNEWFDKCIEQDTQGNLTREQLVNKYMPVFIAGAKVISYMAIEEDTPEIISSLQKTGIKIMGLTSRNPCLKQLTLKCLGDVGIDLSLTCPRDLLPSNGIIYTEGKNKGIKFLKFWKERKEDPELGNIVFVDDGERNVAHMLFAAKTLNIDFYGLRYAGADKMVEYYESLCAKRPYGFTMI